MHPRTRAKHANLYLRLSMCRGPELHVMPVNVGEVFDIVDFISFEEEECALLFAAGHAIHTKSQISKEGNHLRSKMYCSFICINVF